MLYWDDYALSMLIYTKDERSLNLTLKLKLEQYELLASAILFSFYFSNSSEELCKTEF